MARISCSKRLSAAAALAFGLLATTILVAPAQAGSGTFPNPAPITIADNASATPYPSTISVTGLSGPISDVNVTLSGYSHTHPDDVDILLVGPGGQKVILVSDAGGLNDVTAVTLTLDDEAASSLPDETQIAAGPYKPTNHAPPPPSPDPGESFPLPAPSGTYSANLSVFDGATTANGNYSLYVVDDGGGDTGSISGGWSLEIVTIPPNDDFANAEVVNGSTAAVNGTNVGATEQAEPDYCTEDICGNDGSVTRSVWYRWTAPGSGPTTIDTCTTNYDTMLAVFTGSALDSLTEVAKNNNNCASGFGSKVTFDAIAGTTYQIDVDGCCGLPAGTFTLALAGPPPTDTDGDGVPDSSDSCDTQAGPASNGGCPVPPSDADGDGIADPGDSCPTQAGPASNSGCPVPVPSPSDSDGDGIADPNDSCPNQAGPAGSDGCPSSQTARDTQPPQTTITKGPANKTDQHKLKFKFASDEPGSTFECKLDRKPFTACTSPKKLKVDTGKHRFSVRAIDAAGNVDPSPDKDKFKVVD